MSCLNDGGRVSRYERQAFGEVHSGKQRLHPGLGLLRFCSLDDACQGGLEGRVSHVLGQQRARLQFVPLYDEWACTQFVCAVQTMKDPLLV